MHMDEVVYFMVAAAVAPLLILGVKPFSHATWSKLVAAYLVMLSGYAMSIVEGFVLPDALNVVEHLLYSGAALLFFWFAFELRSECRRSAS